MTDSLAAHAWRVKETADYIVGRGYTAVTLQLPDELLGHATQLAGLLQAECSARGHAAQVRPRGRRPARRRRHAALPHPLQELTVHCLPLRWPLPPAAVFAGGHHLQLPQCGRGGSAARGGTVRGEFLTCKCVPSRVLTAHTAVPPPMTPCSRAQHLLRLLPLPFD